VAWLKPNRKGKEPGERGELDREVKAIAEKAGKETTELQAEFNELLKSGKSRGGALAILKSRHLKPKPKYETIAGMVVAMDPVRTTTIDGRKREVANVKWLIKDGDDYRLAKTPLWGDKAKLVGQLWFGETYEFQGRLRRRGRELMVTVPPNAEFKPTDEKLPGIDKVLAKYVGLHSLSEAGKHIGREAAFTGYVGRIIESSEGAKLGFELSDEGVEEPIAVWCRGKLSDILDKLPLGEHVAVIAYVSERKGKPQLNAKAVYPAPKMERREL